MEDNMQVVVITGSSRGIGFGLASAFLERGCAVVVSGSTPESTHRAVESLQGTRDGARLVGIPCDVRHPTQVQALWDEATTFFGKVDIWINNAGLSGPSLKLWEQESGDLEGVIHTNLLGVLYGSKVAMQGMLAQGFGQIYSLEGLGSDGRWVAGLSLYGTTKYALKYLNDALVKETRDTPIQVGALRPGMVVTELIIDPYRGRPDEWRRIKPIFNIIAERVEIVTPWLVDRVLANHKSGARIQYHAGWKILLRFFSALLKQRDIFWDVDL